MQIFNTSDFGMGSCFSHAALIVGDCPRRVGGLQLQTTLTRQMVKKMLSAIFYISLRLFLSKMETSHSLWK